MSERMKIIEGLYKQIDFCKKARDVASDLFHATKKMHYYDEIVFHNGQINALRNIIDELFDQEKKERLSK